MYQARKQSFFDGHFDNCDRIGILSARAIIFAGVLLSQVIKSRNQYFFAGMNELTLVLRFTTLIATTYVSTICLNFQACRSPKTGRLQVHGARYYGR